MPADRVDVRCVDKLPSWQAPTQCGVGLQWVRVWSDEAACGGGGGGGGQEREAHHGHCVLVYEKGLF